jgi:Lon protease-like protein
MELGLFPLGIVLLPTERVPLHIFEHRYQELIGECLAEQREFGLLFADDEGVREIGTLASIVEVLDRFPDGRLNILVEGGERFRVVAETSGRSFLTAEVEPVGDDERMPEQSQRETVLELYRRLGEVIDQEVDEPNPDTQLLSYELAARVDFGPERKQELLELRSESDRLTVLSRLLEQAAEAITLERALAEASARNGRGLRQG